VRIPFEIDRNRTIVGISVAGSHTLHDVAATFPVAEVRSRQAGADAVLGSQLLRRFDLVFDYEASTLWIRPSDAYSEPF
jgi:hypothetical protein